jgi:hypothetical protein
MPLPPALAHLVAELNTAAQNYDDKNTLSDDSLSPYAPEARALSKAAEQLSDLLKPVEEKIWMFIFQPSALACANIAFNCGLLAPWPKSRMSAEELADLTKADEKLISMYLQRAVTTVCKQFADKFHHSSHHERTRTVQGLL